ncbi:MAG: AI-2E family transporter [Salinigranum sp.]
MDRNRAFLLVSIAVFLALGALVVLPLLQYVLLAVLLAYVLHPLHRRFSRRVGARVAAGALVLAAVFAVVVPVVVLLDVMFAQALALVRAVGTNELDLAAVERYVAATVGVQVDLAAVARSLLRAAQSGLVGNALDLFGGVASLLVGLTVVLFVLYYLLKDGEDFVAWLREVTPLAPDVQDELAARVDRIMWAVFVVNVAIAAVQAILTGVGFAVVGLPNVVFWTVATFVLALLPLIGASVVWLPAAGYLAVTGQIPSAAFLFVYGSVVVSLSDNYLRPVAGGREADLNPGLFVVGIFGGVAAIGFMGLFFGPLVLGVLKAFLDVSDRVFEPEDAASG